MNRLFTKNRYGNNVIDSSVQSLSIFKQFFLNKNIINKYKKDSKLVVNLLRSIAARQTNDSLKVLIPVLGVEEFIKHACIPSARNSTMFERACAVPAGNLEVIKILLAHKLVRQQYTNSEYWLYRLLYHLFGCNHENMDSIDYVIDELKLSKSKSNNINRLVVKTIFDYTYKEILKKEDLLQFAHDYSKDTILSRCGKAGNSKILEKCISVVGEKAFITNVLKPSAGNTTLLKNAIRHGKIEMIKLVLSYNKIKQEIIGNNYWLFRTLWRLFRDGSRDIIDIVIKTLNITKDDIVDLTNYKYKEVGQTPGARAKNHENCHIVPDIGLRGNDAGMEALISIVGDTQFSKFVFVQNTRNTTILENAIRKNNSKIIKSIVCLNYVKQIYQSDSYWIYRLFWWYQWGKINTDNKILLFKDIVTDLSLTQEKSVELLKDYQYKENDPGVTNFVK